MRESVAKMKSFSLDIPVLKKTIVELDASIKNIEQIGIDIVCNFMFILHHNIYQPKYSFYVINFRAV